MTEQNPKPGNTADPAATLASIGILSYGYRPFFLFAGAWAAIALAVWIATLTGRVDLPTRFDPVSWHAHEMLFGYLSAVIAGFLLTAVPNWTGRPPIIGLPLAVLTALWFCGRVAIALSEHINPVLVAGLDLVFPVVLALVIGREILAANNRRNLIVLGMLVLFATANGWFHVSAFYGEYAAGEIGFRMGLAVAVMMICVIGGRIIPNFTRNWLVAQGAEPRISQFGWVDQAVLIATLICLVGWTIWPEHKGVAAVCFVAGALNLVRLARWRGWQARSESLLWILHVGFGFIPLGFLAIALSGWGVSASTQIGAQHIWTAGAIGVTTLAVMSRASLGHAGRPLVATSGVTRVYLLVIAAVLLRFVSATASGPVWVLYTAFVAWVAGFTGFVILFWPILTKRRG